MYGFKKYLAEATKQYDFIIKVAGELDEKFENKLETSLGKFDVANMSSGKKTPIQSLPLDFPEYKNMEVTVYEVTLNYPTTQNELRQFIANSLQLDINKLRVRKPGEPYEEYQANQSDEETYEAKLGDAEYKDSPAVNKDDLVVTEKGKESFLAQLAKEAKDRFKEEN